MYEVADFMNYFSKILPKRICRFCQYIKRPFFPHTWNLIHFSLMHRQAEAPSSKNCKSAYDFLLFHRMKIMFHVKRQVSWIFSVTLVERNFRIALPFSDRQPSTMGNFSGRGE